MQTQTVVQKQLSNGLTILVKPAHAVPKVSLQLWYNVGSKDEGTGEKGIAHLIEHMLFKGTERLSECDINLITHKLSGYCNAFTSYDYTGYMFDFPAEHWHEALPILADCMSNAQFKEEYLNSELKAVIQELKMYRDDYGRMVVKMILAALFPDHPYHYSVIGFKQDLWTASRESLISFYRKHYIPNNATLVIVGDVDPQEVFAKVEDAFGSIPANPSYKKEEFYHSSDIIQNTVTLYREVKQSQVYLSWVVPGLKQKKLYLIEIVNWIVGAGKGSRLYKKLVNELELVTSLESFSYDLFDDGVFFIFFQPTDIKDIPQIIDIISTELQNLVNTLEEHEIQRAIRKTEVEYLNKCEDNQTLASMIGETFLATGDASYFARYLEYPKQKLAEEVKAFVVEYLRPSIMTIGQVLPLAESEKPYILKLQEVSDAEDERILAGKTRFAEVEEGKVVHQIEVQKPKGFTYPRAKNGYLPNGLKLLTHHNPGLPKIDLIIDLKAKHYYDPAGKEGLGLFVAQLLQEGTTTHSATEFAELLESYGMNLYIEAGYISLNMLAKDLEVGLGLLREILTQAAFDDEAISRIRAQMGAEIESYWDQPKLFVGQIMRNVVYENHPYNKPELGTLESIGAITRTDIVNYYKTYVSPQGARLALAGDLTGYDVEAVLTKAFNSWTGPIVPDLVFPQLSPVSPSVYDIPVVRDQIVLAYVGLSVNRLSPEYDSLFLFDQIFSGGVLRSMSSRLFDLRERTGLFYTISGSLVAHADQQPGMSMVKTIVSQDRLAEAERVIEEVINTTVNTLNNTELEEARRAILSNLVDNFSSDYKTASILLAKDIFGLSDDYFDNRHKQLSQVTLEQVQENVRKYLSTKHMAKIRIGRI